MRVILNEDDGTMTVEWDENDPFESQMNDWTEEQFLEAIEDVFLKTVDEWEYDDDTD